MEERHPGLYWYTTKHEMDSIFAIGRNEIKSSMTEFDFRKLLMPVVSNIRCGHTTVMSSKKYMKYIDTVSAKTAFPFTVKVWNDTIVFTSIKDTSSGIQRGYILDSLNGQSAQHLLDTMYRYMSADGGNLVAKNQLLSTGTYFGSLYTALFGWQASFDIGFRDSSGNAHRASLTPAPASKTNISKKDNAKKIPKSERLLRVRSLKIDSSTALMELNSFSEKLKIKQFVRKSFKTLTQKKTNNLILDLRSNGGGQVANAVFLLRYLSHKPFKIADSLYAITNKSKYSKYISNDFLTLISISIFSKRTGGKFHYRYFEKHFFRPQKRNHFDGTVYILSGGLTYSASVLVLDVLKDQYKTHIVGEPSGGAAYGNSATKIPIATLPNTKIRFRLPLFRMVIDKNFSKNSCGVQPDIFTGPTTEAIRNGEDYNMKKVQELIQNRKQ